MKFPTFDTTEIVILIVLLILGLVPGVLFFLYKLYVANK